MKVIKRGVAILLIMTLTLMPINVFATPEQSEEEGLLLPEVMETTATEPELIVEDEEDLVIVDETEGQDLSESAESIEVTVESMALIEDSSEEDTEEEELTGDEELLVETGVARIHYIGLRGSTDAILLESNGRFGMIDSGEDWDYPDGSDGRYPLRQGITVNQGFDMQVINYLVSLGVNSSNFDFYIGSHAHSDHIGLADDIIAIFGPSRIYLKRYDDSRMVSPGGVDLYDNQYVYDGLVAAVRKYGGTLIQDVEEGSTITLGDMTLQFFNTAVRSGISNENENCFVIKAFVNNTVTLLTADITEDILWELFEAGHLEDIDILKIPHHGYANENPGDIISEISPKEVIVTGSSIYLNDKTRMILSSINARIFSTNNNVAAIVTDYSGSGYLTSELRAQEGWWNYEGELYYITSTGELAIGWRAVGGSWYYFERGTGKGRMLTGLHKIGTEWYYFAEGGNYRGEMMTGRQEVDGQSYYFMSDGRRQGGWQYIAGYWYYFDEESGKLTTGWQEIDNEWYYLDSNDEGRMLSGWQRLNGYWYYLGNKESGKRQVGWQMLDGSWYYLDKKSGRSSIGWQEIDNEWYYLDGNNKGRMLSGWQRLNGYWYYLGNDDSGRRHSGWQRISSRWYYLSDKEDNRMLSEWQRINGHWYYLSGAEDGRMMSDWQIINGQWYYLSGSEDGRMTYEWQSISGQWYYLSDADDGRMLSGWQVIGGMWYYFGSASSGKMVTGRHRIDDQWYTFASSGRWIG